MEEGSSDSLYYSVCMKNVRINNRLAEYEMFLKIWNGIYGKFHFIINEMLFEIRLRVMLFALLHPISTSVYNFNLA